MCSILRLLWLEFSHLHLETNQNFFHEVGNGTSPLRGLHSADRFLLLYLEALRLLVT